MLLGRRQFVNSVLGGLALSQFSGCVQTAVASSSGMIALNANENPYGPSARALQAAREASANGAYYSFPKQAELVAKIASLNGLERSMVALSTGSNEALCGAAAAYGKNGPIVAPSLTFSAHLSYARNVGLSVQTIDLTDDMAIDLDAMARSVAPSTGLVYICNPNNPTGLPLDSDRLRDFCREVSKTVPVLIDEAYNELSDDPQGSSMLDLVRAGHNVIVTRTFSKVFGLAGMRLGYAMAPPEVLKPVKKHIMSWVNAPAVAAALACVDDQEFVDFSREKIVQARELVLATYARHGIKPLSSKTNFVFADIGRDAKTFADELRAHGVNIGNPYRGYPNWSRVSMGKLEDVRTFSKVFSDVYSGVAG